MTIQELAQRTNVSTAIISQLERGIGNPTLKVLTDLANELGISLSELVKEDIKNCDLILRRENRMVSYYGEDRKQMMCNLLVDSPLHTALDVAMLTLEPHCESVDGFTEHLEEDACIWWRGRPILYFQTARSICSAAVIRCGLCRTGSTSCAMIPTRPVYALI